MPEARISGFVHSSDGGGTEFSHARADQPLRFELTTSFWRTTTFSLPLRTEPALPPGTVLKVGMDVDY